MEQDFVAPIRFIRGRLSGLVAKTPAAVADDVPPNCRNSLRWQLGHVVTVTERVAVGLSGVPVSYPEEWLRYFGPGTTIYNFDAGTPSWSDLATALEASTAHLAATIPGLDPTAPLAVPFTPAAPTLKMEFVWQAVSAAPLHDAAHFGMMRVYYRILTNHSPDD